MSDLKRIVTPFSYSLAVVAGDYVFLGLHRGSGEHFQEQLDNAMAKLKKTLAEVGLTLDGLVKVNVWLKHVQDMEKMNDGFYAYFQKDHFPARMTATTEFIDADCLLMIEGVAYIQK